MKRIGTVIAIAFSFLAMTATVANAGMILPLQPADGETTVAYNHTFSTSVPKHVSNDTNAFLLANTGYYDDGGSYSWHVTAAGYTTAGIRYEFVLTPPADDPLATLESISVTSHCFDWDAASYVAGTWDTDLTGSWTEFYNTDGTFNDNNGIVTRTLSGAGIEGATSLKLRYIAYKNDGNITNQRIFGVHPNATTDWTFNVTANWGPEPATLSLLVLGTVMLVQRRK